MCGICGLWLRDGGVRRPPRRDARLDRPPWPGRRHGVLAFVRATASAVALRRARAGSPRPGLRHRPWASPARDHRPRRAAISRCASEDGCIGWSSTARSTTTSSCAPSWRRSATVPDRVRHRGAAARLRGVRGRLRWTTSTACSPSRSGTTPTRRLFLARDHFGVKPLYYAADRARVCFGSEIKAILASGLVSGRSTSTRSDLALTFRYTPSP